MVRVERGVQAEPQGQVRVCDEQAANGDQVGVAYGMGRGPARDGAGTEHLFGAVPDAFLAVRCTRRNANRQREQLRLPGWEACMHSGAACTGWRGGTRTGEKPQVHLHAHQPAAR